MFKLRASDVRDDTDAKQLSAQSLFDRDFLVCSRHPDDPKAKSALTNAEYVLISPADGAASSLAGKHSLHASAAHHRSM